MLYVVRLQQKPGGGDSILQTPANHLDLLSSRSGSGDGDMTGEVGTALYVSPEMMKGGSKLRYDQVCLSAQYVKRKCLILTPKNVFDLNQNSFQSVSAHWLMWALIIDPLVEGRHHSETELTWVSLCSLTESGHLQPGHHLLRDGLQGAALTDGAHPGADQPEEA